MNRLPGTILSFIGIVVLLLCTGCAGTLFKNYGSITPDQETTKAFENYQINPDFNYYFSGSDVYPNALIGLNKTYTLDSTLWKKIEVTPKTFQEMIHYMQTKAMSLNMNQHGFAIIDDKGKKIGVWYSILSARTSVRMIDDHTVMVLTPDLDTYEKRDTEWSDRHR